MKQPQANLYSLSAWVAPTMLGWLVLLSAQAASFDCAKAQTDIEKAICSDPALSSLDVDLGKAYKQALRQSADAKQTSAEQREWLEIVRNACHDTSCINAAYIARINELTKTSAAQQRPRKDVKHAARKVHSSQEFVSFIKEREFLGDPYETASPEAERLLKFMRAQYLSMMRETETKIFSDTLEEYEGYEYLKIAKDKFIVSHFFGISLEDMNTQQSKTLVSGIGTNVVGNGIFSDGTGWILTEHGSRSTEWGVSAFDLITYLSMGQKVDVVSTPLVHESISFEAKNGHWCGIGEEQIMKGIAGKVLGHEWKDINNDGQNELVFNLEEVDCSKPDAAPVERQRSFAVSKGQVNELH